MNSNLLIRGRGLRAAFLGLLCFFAQGAFSQQTLTLNAGDTLTLFTGETLAADVVVGNGAVLTGEGAVTGALTVSGLLDPGLSSDTAGTLTVGGGATFNPEAVLRLHLFADGSSDLINGAATSFVLGGTLKAVVPDGYTAADRTFTVLINSATVSGAFDNVADSRVFAYLADDSQPGERFTVAAPDGGAITLTDYKAEQAIANFLPVTESVFLTTDTATLSADASSGLAVSFTVADGPGILSGGTGLAFSSYGTVLVVASQSGNEDWAAAADVTNSFTVHGIPATGPVTLQRVTNQLLKVTTTMLLANTTDPEGSALTAIWVSPGSTNGGSVTLSGRWVIYTPPEGSVTDDFFQFRVRNAFGGETVGTAKVETMGPADDDSSALNLHITSVEGSAELRIFGIPGRACVVQGSTRLANPDWSDLGSCTIGAGGYVQFNETNPPPSRYYRTRKP